MDKAKVLMVVSSELCKAGQPSVVMKIVKHLSDSYSFDVLVMSDTPGYYDKEFLSYGGQIYRVRVLKFEKHRVLSPLRCLQILRITRSLLSANKYRIVHSHIGFESGIIMRAATKTGVPVRVSHAHGTYMNRGKNILRRAYLAWCQKYNLRYANRRIACATIAGEALFPGLDYENVLNPVDTVYYSSIVRRKHEGLRLLQIGYYAKEKNQLFSVEILRQLTLQGNDAYLVFIGFVQDNAYYDEVMRLISHYGLEERVQALPFDADQSEQLAIADAVLLPSSTEGLPLVALEAQMAHVPCLMSDRIGIDADMGMSYFLAHNSVEDWVECILRVSSSYMMLNEDKVDRITESGYAQRIRSIYDSACIADVRRN